MAKAENNTLETFCKSSTENIPVPSVALCECGLDSALFFLWLHHLPHTKAISHFIENKIDDCIK